MLYNKTAMHTIMKTIALLPYQSSLQGDKYDQRYDTQNKNDSSITGEYQLYLFEEFRTPQLNIPIMPIMELIQNQ